MYLHNRSGNLYDKIFLIKSEIHEEPEASLAHSKN